ncbi:MAG: ion channel [Amphritea sp.]
MILLDWYFIAKGISHPLLNFITDWFIWICFIAEATILLSKVDNKRRYLRENWMNSVIILAGLPVVLGLTPPVAGAMRILRLLIMVEIFFRLSRDAHTILSRHHLGATLSICFIIMLVSGVLISGIDPAFSRPLDAIWWAWVTITTIGYGDLVPSTGEGRIFGALLILMRLGLFSMITASFSVFFIEQDEREFTDKEERNLQRIALLEKRLEGIEGKLEQSVNLLEQIKQDNRSEPDNKPNKEP